MQVLLLHLWKRLGMVDAGAPAASLEELRGMGACLSSAKLGISAVLGWEWSSCWLGGRFVVNNSCILCKELSKRIFLTTWRERVARGDRQGFWFFCFHEWGLKGIKMSSVPEVFFPSFLSSPGAWIAGEDGKSFASYLISLVIWSGNTISAIKGLNLEAVCMGGFKPFTALGLHWQQCADSDCAEVRMEHWVRPWVCHLFRIQTGLIFALASDFLSFYMGGGKKVLPAR